MSGCWPEVVGGDSAMMKSQGDIGVVYPPDSSKSDGW